MAVCGEALIFAISPNGKTNIISTFSPGGVNLLEMAMVSDPYFNAWFFHRSVFEKLGNLNTAYRIAADRDFMLRFALSGLPYETIDKLVYRYRFHAGSMTFDMTDQKLQRIIDEHLCMTSFYLDQGNLPMEARNSIRQLRTRDTIIMAYRSLKKLDFQKAGYYSQQGIRHDRLWFINLARRVLHKKPL